MSILPLVAEQIDDDLWLLCVTKTQINQNHLADALRTVRSITDCEDGSADYAQVFILIKLGQLEGAKGLCRKAIGVRRKNPKLPYEEAYEHAIQMMISILTHTGNDNDEIEFYESLLPASDDLVKNPTLSHVEEVSIQSPKQPNNSSEEASSKLGIVPDKLVKQDLQRHNIGLGSDGITVTGSGYGILEAVNHVVTKSDVTLAEIIFRGTLAYFHYIYEQDTNNNKPR